MAKVISAKRLQAIAMSAQFGVAQGWDAAQLSAAMKEGIFRQEDIDRAIGLLEAYNASRIAAQNCRHCKAQEYHTEHVAI